MNQLLRQQYAESSERIYLGVAEPEDYAVTTRQRNVDKHEAIQEAVTLISILLLTLEIVAILSACIQGASWLR